MTSLYLTITTTDEAIPEFTRQERWPLVMDPVCKASTLYYPNTQVLRLSPLTPPPAPCDPTYSRRH